MQEDPNVIDRKAIAAAISADETFHLSTHIDEQQGTGSIDSLTEWQSDVCETRLSSQMQETVPWHGRKFFF